MPVQVSEDEVARAICSFPCGSTGGRDALRPQHLKDMISKSALGVGFDVASICHLFCELCAER